MSNEKLYEIIRYPVITEKSTRILEQNKYVFEVMTCASKDMIKKAIKLVFNVDAIKVNTINVPGKEKIFRGRRGKQKDFKKAIVTIAAGQNIDTAVGI